jgi:putative ATP-binding cassette transporter
VDNFSTLADWRATLLRVAGFRRAVIGTDDMHDVESRITYAAAKDGTFGIEDLQIASPSGATLLQEKKVHIKKGEHVLIVGDSGSGKTLLFRALAGLWPWGSGSVTRPAGEEILYMPRTPYLPPGTLREVLAYPKTTDAFESERYAIALSRLGLERFAAQLDSPQRWDRDLNEDDQQALAFAHVLLHRAPWVLIDEVLDSLDDEALKRVVDVFAKDLPQSGVIHIGRSDAHQFMSRVLHLIKDPMTRKLASPSPLLATSS